MVVKLTILTHCSIISVQAGACVCIDTVSASTIVETR